MIYLLAFIAGMIAGHIMSPWIDGKLADLAKEDHDDSEWRGR